MSEPIASRPSLSTLPDGVATIGLRTSRTKRRVFKASRAPAGARGPERWLAAAHDLLAATHDLYARPIRRKNGCQRESPCSDGRSSTSVAE